MGNLSGQLNAKRTFDRNVFYGFDFENNDNKQYLAPTPTTGSNITMSLEDPFGNDDASELGDNASSSQQSL